MGTPPRLQIRVSVLFMTLQCPQTILLHLCFSHSRAYMLDGMSLGPHQLHEYLEDGGGTVIP